MSLLSGSELDPKRFFKHGNPIKQASGFNLTVGKIYDSEGAEVFDHFTLQPGSMVQVVSAEVFSLKNDVTGHVTYKTGLTSVGIWALTVGIVDPGWEGPISTSLLNFSSVPYTIHQGDEFLRVSFFEHGSVPEDTLRQSPTLLDYQKGVQKLAASTFPPTFLNTDKIEESAGNAVLHKIRTQALVWVVALALLFTLLQAAVRYLPLPYSSSMTLRAMQVDIDRLSKELERDKTFNPNKPVVGQPAPGTDPEG